MLSKQNALARFYVSASVFVTVVIAAVDPYSQHGEAMKTDGAGGMVGMSVLGVLSLAGMVDVLVNDWFPEKMHWHFPHAHRHLIYMFMALGMFSLMLAIAQSGDVRPVIGRYLLDACTSVYIAVKGVQYHYVERMSRAHDHL